MIYLEEFENSSIEILYHGSGSKGRMHIRVKPFMEGQNLTKIKKLIGIIRTSDTPDVWKPLSDYCDHWLKEYEFEQKTLAKEHVNAQERVRKVQIDIIDFQRKKEIYKKGSEHYKHFTELLKEKRKELSAEKETVRSTLNEFNRNKGIKDKFEKVLKYINQGG